MLRLTTLAAIIALLCVNAALSAAATDERGDFILMIERIEDAAEIEPGVQALNARIAELGPGPQAGWVKIDTLTVLAYGVDGGSAWGVDPTTERSKEAARLLKREHPDAVWLKIK